MLKWLARVFVPSGESPFECYYRRLLGTNIQVAPKADEARRDFRDALLASLAGLV